MPYEPPPELAALSLAEIVDAVAARRVPPVDQWSPASTGESHMRIAANGQWFHEGSPITRPAMVRAFGYCNDTVESGSPSRLCPAITTSR